VDDTGDECGASETPMTPLMQDDALRRAVELARDDDRDIDDYDEPVVERDGGDWIVFFQGRDLRPGRHFMVVLDAETGRGRLVEGR
jgi:hypothetical protein